MHRRVPLVLALFALLTAAAFGHDHEHGPADLRGVRLLVAALDGPELLVLDAADGHVLGRFTTPGVGHARQLPNAQLAAVVHRDANRVTFVHGGLTAIDHGDHADLVEGPPYVLQTVNYGPRPGALVASGHDVAIHLDGDGGVAWLDARLLGVSLAFADVPGAGPDEGSLALLGGHLLVSGRDAAGVRVIAREGTVVATFDGCPGADAPAVAGNAAVFGCDDGVLVVELGDDGAFTAYHLAYPDGVGVPAGTRLGTLAAADAAPVLFGAFGDGLARLDPAARALAIVPLPAAAADLRFADDGAALVVLTLDGALHALDPSTGAVVASVALLDPWTMGAARPSLALLEEAAFVVDPAGNAVWALDLDQLEVVARFELPFAPGSAAVLAIPGVARH